MAKPKNGLNNSINWRKDNHALKKYEFVYHFLPHPQEKRRASLLSNKSFIGYCFAIFLVGFFFRVLPALLPGILGYASNINTNDLLSYTNKRRDAAGLSDLKLNDELSQAAAKKAAHMFKHNYWAHVAPDGTEPWDFILGAGYDYIYAGENLAKNFSDSKGVVDAWYNSPSHRDNLLSKNYTEVGYAVVNGVLNGYQTTLVVQMFGKPRVPVAKAPEADKVATAPKVIPAPVPVTQPVPAPTPQEQPVTPSVPVTEEKPITETTIPNPTPSEAVTVKGFSEPVPVSYQQVNVSPKVDIVTASHILTLLFGVFIIVLLGLDYWYTKKLGIVKINGHTLAHIAFLMLVIVSIWFVLKPGAVI